MPCHGIPPAEGARARARSCRRAACAPRDTAALEAARWTVHGSRAGTAPRGAAAVGAGRACLSPCRSALRRPARPLGPVRRVGAGCRGHGHRHARSDYQNHQIRPGQRRSSSGQQQPRSRPQDPKRHQWLKPPDAMRSCSPARPRSPGSGSVPAAVSLTGSMGGGTLPRFASRHPQPKKPSSSACRSGRPAARPGASPKRHATARRYVAAKERPAFFYCCSHHGTHPFFIFYSIFWLVTVKKITLDASSFSRFVLHACVLLVFCIRAQEEIWV